MTDKETSFNLYQPQPLLIVISGPSGVGKDTVVDHMKECGLPFHFVITATTRPPRTDETPGVDYFFYSWDEFTRMIENDELLEYAMVYSDYKGIPKAQVQQAMVSGKDVVMRLDVQGAATIRKLCPEAVLIFLSTQDEAELADRLKSRKTEDAQEFELRMATARNELEQAKEFDYVVLNKDGQLEETVDVIKAIIRSEHHRIHHRKVTL
jgi:guanylate kinase